MTAWATAAGATLCAAAGLAVAAAHHPVHAESSPVTPAGSWGTVWTWAVIAALVLYLVGVVVTRSCALAYGLTAYLLLADAVHF